MQGERVAMKAVVPWAIQGKVQYFSHQLVEHYAVIRSSTVGWDRCIGREKKNACVQVCSAVDAVKLRCSSRADNHRHRTLERAVGPRLNFNPSLVHLRRLGAAHAHRLGHARPTMQVKTTGQRKPS
jgi:hypothetical protein